MRPSDDRPRYPEHRERFGEDPARILASSMDPEPRINGIGDLGLLNAWAQVAREMDANVEQAIEQRRNELLQIQ